MQVSAFVDGELPENEAELLVRRLSQDAVLRQQVAEYLAIGRVMRGEYTLKGSNTLRERVAAELDERPMQEAENSGPASERTRYLRPLAGFAIAASVALVAIFGLRQTSVDVDPATATVAAEEVVFETVPAVSDEELRPLFILHNEAVGARLTSAPMRADEIVDEAVEEIPESADEADEEEPVSSQP